MLVSLSTMSRSDNGIKRITYLKMFFLNTHQNQPSSHYAAYTCKVAGAWSQSRLTLGLAFTLVQVSSSSQSYTLGQKMLIEMRIAHTLTFTPIGNLESSSINQVCMCLHCGRKLENPRRTCAGIRENMQTPPREGPG